MRLQMMRWRFKTVLKIILAVFIVSTCIVHYTNEKFEKTREILKGIGGRGGGVDGMVQPWIDSFIINWKGKGVVMEGGGESIPFLVVVITSHPSNVERRNIIRESWMKYSPKRNVVVVFFCGRPRIQDMPRLNHESEKFDDIVADDFEEHYYGLTVKTLRILKWFNMNLGKAGFLVKTDDDVYVNTPKLVEYLEEKVRNRYMGGVLVSGRYPHTLNTFSKWYVIPKLWKEQVRRLSSLTKDFPNHRELMGYPPYLEGNFYVMSGDLVPLLLNASLQLPLFHLEDVFLSGFVANELLRIECDQIPRVFTDSAISPQINYKYNKLFTSPKDIIAYHFDNEVKMITQIYQDSLAK